MAEKTKKNLKQIYDEKAPFVSNIPSFNELYEKMEKECRKFNGKRKKLKHFKSGLTVDYLDIFTKYDLDNYIFQIFYQDISLLIDRENYINRLKFNKGKDPVKVLPKKLQNNVIKYEISFFNSVTESGMLMINYYFKLNDETKNYLLNYEMDFDLDELQDLTLYQNNKMKFYSCTHE